VFVGWILYIPATEDKRMTKKKQGRPRLYAGGHVRVSVGLTTDQARELRALKRDMSPEAETADVIRYLLDASADKRARETVYDGSEPAVEGPRRPESRTRATPSHRAWKYGRS
jgi:hypothetical protein